MRRVFLRIFGGILLVALVTAVVWADPYTQELIARDAGKKAEKSAAIEADQRKRAGEEQERQNLERQREEEHRKEEERRQEERRKEEEHRLEETYELTPVDGEHDLFINKADGYTLQVPAGMTVDMRFSNVCAALEKEDLKLEIYRQELPDPAAAGAESYINYSNRFLENRTDHYREAEGKTQLDAGAASWLQWSRRPLAKIENDRRHYASVEVVLSDGQVITLLFKSSRKFEAESYLKVTASMKLTEKSAEPYVQKLRKEENNSWDRKTAAVYEEYFGDGAGLRWGIFEAAAPVDFTELKKIEASLNFTFPVLLYYTGILEDKEGHPDLAAALENAKREGRLPELTLQPQSQAPGKGNMVYDILDGKYDTYLKNYAEEVVRFGEPVLFRLGNEMNGDWCVYSAYHTSKDTDLFKAFYRYVYEIFEAAGARNVIWVWNPNGKSFPDFKWNHELCYYPGDRYVDVVGMTGYNTGTYYEDESWTEFHEIYDPLYEKYTALTEKPLMITEFSSSSVGGSKEAWVAGMFRSIGRYERIRVAVWWDGCDWDGEGNVARPYFIDESPELVRLFRENLAPFKEMEI